MCDEKIVTGVTNRRATNLIFVDFLSPEATKIRCVSNVFLFGNIEIYPFKTQLFSCGNEVTVKGSDDTA